MTQTYKIPSKTIVFHRSTADSKCNQYALQELQRLLGRVGVLTEPREDQGNRAAFFLAIGNNSESKACSADLLHDGFKLAVSAAGIELCANTAKGLLNGVYYLAEQLGYLFLLPGEAGEWAPDRVVNLPVGQTLMQPRFPFRGVFWNPLGTNDYTDEEWLRFYAKLKFNALSDRIVDVQLVEELGIRLEVGDHGLSHLLSRDLFKEKPDLFRMFQPEDFNGKRLNDSNVCITNPDARKIIKENFKTRLQSVQGAYGIHAWADDLPAGGWCLCPACRSFSPADQSMLAMNLLAETARECQSAVRVANIAYHDTLYPGVNISPASECFLVFAPRERCYGHALDDSKCARNRYYLAALKAWGEKFNHISDNHTFEYYFDQILFRGIYPFLPQVILDDMTVYQGNGIESHMSLQIAGPELAPEFNMLLFAEAHWNEKLTVTQFCQTVSSKLAGGGVPAWEEYLLARGEIFTRAMRTCDHDVSVYLDYRWLPESTSAFAREMVEIYADASRELVAAAERLAAGVGAAAPERLLHLTRGEVQRAKFEAAELQVMHYQQNAVIHFADYLNTGNRESADKGCDLMSAAIEAFQVAKSKALEFGLTEKSWYIALINQWLTGEFERKINNYKRA